MSIYHPDEYSGRGVIPRPENVKLVREMLRTMGPVRSARALGLSRNAVMAVGAATAVHSGTDAQVSLYREREAQP